MQPEIDYGESPATKSVLNQVVDGTVSLAYAGRRVQIYPPTENEQPRSDKQRPSAQTQSASAQESRVYASRWLPTFATSLADPFITLRHQIDVERHFSEIEIDRPGEPSADSSSGGKKKTLRKLMRKGESAREDAAPVRSSKIKARISEDQKIRLGRELARITKDLSSAVDNFVALSCSVCSITTREIIQELTEFAPYLMLDNSIAKHPKLIGMRLTDNTTYIELGRTLLRAHALASSCAQGQTLANANQRIRRMDDLLDVWITRRSPTRARNAMPVMWTLEASTHEPLAETFLEKRTRDMMREVPLLMIATLHVMCLREERDKLVREIFDDAL